MAFFEGPKADSLAESFTGSLIFFICDNPPTYFKLLKFLNFRTIFLLYYKQKQLLLFGQLYVLFVKNKKLFFT
jgi:hypothetical protein